MAETAAQFAAKILVLQQLDEQEQKDHISNLRDKAVNHVIKHGADLKLKPISPSHLQHVGWADKELKLDSTMVSDNNVSAKKFSSAKHHVLYDTHNQAYHVYDKVTNSFDSVKRHELSDDDSRSRITDKLETTNFSNDEIGEDGKRKIGSYRNPSNLERVTSVIHKDLSDRDS